jgi:ribosome biogenesis GTPase / thiamine phosphate phosphatase
MYNLCFLTVFMTIMFSSKVQRLAFQIQSSNIQKMVRSVAMSTQRVDERPEKNDFPLIKAYVLERRGDRLLVEFSDSSNVLQKTICVQKAQFSSNQEHIVPGDYVEIALPNNPQDFSIIYKLLDRKNVLQRPSATSTMKKIVMKPIASNIDQLLVVTALKPLVPLHTIDRYLVSAYVHDIPEVTIVINKADLEGSQEYYQSLQYYEQQLGHKMIFASTKSSTGLDNLLLQLQNKTSIFVGQSGVGKSSLINVLIPNMQLSVNSLVGGGNFGAHTTSIATVYDLPALNAKIIDSPGIRELGIWHLDLSFIQAGFREIDQFAKICKYRNCAHRLQDEAAQCAVVAAVKKGDIHLHRYQSFMMLREQKYQK